MQPLMILVTGILATVILASLANFRFLLYPLIPSLNPVNNRKQLTLSGNTLFISDLHLRTQRSFMFVNDLRDFIVSNHVSNLVIDGDLFDSPRDARELLDNHTALRKLGIEGLPIEVYWVTGSPGHDLTKMGEWRLLDGGLNVVGQCASISCGKFDVFAYHGHDLSCVGAFGHAWNRFIARLSLEKLWKRFARVDNATWVVFGHIHIPGVDLKSRVANCGGWMTVPVLVKPTGTGMLFSNDGDSPELVQIAKLPTPA